MPSVITDTSRVRASSTWSFELRPSARGVPSTIYTTATAGIVKPMLASAEPSARFMLV